MLYFFFQHLKYDDMGLILQTGSVIDKVVSHDPTPIKCAEERTTYTIISASDIAKTIHVHC